MIRQERTISLIVPQKILLWHKQKHITIRYTGATLYEQLQLLEASSDEARMAFFISYIEKHANTTITPQDWQYLFSHLWEIIEHIMETAFHTAQKPQSTNTERSPTASYIAFLCKELSIPPRELLTYTIQEIAYLNEGITRNINAQSEEGQRINKLATQQYHAQQHINKNKKQIDEFLKK